MRSVSGCRSDPAGMTCVHADGSDQTVLSMRRFLSSCLPFLRNGQPLFGPAYALSSLHAFRRGAWQRRNMKRCRADRAVQARLLTIGRSGRLFGSGSSHAIKLRQVPPRHLVHPLRHAKQCLVCRRGELPGGWRWLDCFFASSCQGLTAARSTATFPSGVRVTERT